MNQYLFTNDLGDRQRASRPQTADFGSGNVSGYIMEMRVVPEPSALLLVLAATVAMPGRTRRRGLH